MPKITTSPCIISNRTVVPNSLPVLHSLLVLTASKQLGSPTMVHILLG